MPNKAAKRLGLGGYASASSHGDQTSGKAPVRSFREETRLSRVAYAQNARYPNEQRRCSERSGYVKQNP